jgi:hypothetical protein
VGGDAVVCGGFAVWLAVLGLVVRVTGATAFCHLSVAISSFPGVAFSPFLRCPGLFLAGLGEFCRLWRVWVGLARFVASGWLWWRLPWLSAWRLGVVEGFSVLGLGARFWGVLEVLGWRFVMAGSVEAGGGGEFLMVKISRSEWDYLCGLRERDRASRGDVGVREGERASSFSGEPVSQGSSLE